MKPLTSELTDVLTGACDLIDTTIFHSRARPILYNQMVLSDSTTLAFHNLLQVYKIFPASMVGGTGFEPVTFSV